MRRGGSGHLCILAVTPFYRGFGYAVLDGEILADWGAKVLKGDRNAKSLSKVKALIAECCPDVLVVEDFRSKPFRRGSRIQCLLQQLADLAASRNIKVKLVARHQINRVYCAGERASKDRIAANLVKRFPEELGFLLPPKRRLWKSEDYRISIFEAVALGLMV